MYRYVIGLHFNEFLNKALILLDIPTSEVVLMPKLNEKKENGLLDR